MNPRNQKIRTLLLRLALALAVVTAPTIHSSRAFAMSEELVRLLDTAAGRYILTDTDRGSEIVERALGRRLAPGEDLAPLLDRLNDPDMSRVANKLEANMKQIQRGYAERFGYLGDQNAFTANLGRDLNAAEKQVLETLALDELRIQISFYPAEIANSYDATRATFMRMLEMAPEGQPIKRYPLGVNPLVHPDWHLQYGFESEYALSESERLLTAYGPSDEFGISKGQWLNMSPAERLSWVNDHLDELFPQKNVGKLVKITDDPELSMLPDNLIKDDTGNVEIVLQPVNTLEDWKKMVTTINTKLGTGSMQGAMSAPSDAFFGRVNGLTKQQAFEQNLGFFSFMADYDALQKLEQGAARYAADPTKEVAKAFNHPYLGPLTRPKQELLARYLGDNADGRLLDPHSLDMLRANDFSFKYAGTTSYRPDIVPPNRVVLEVRDAHANMNTLMDRMLRGTFYLEFGRAPFAKAAELKAFDPAADFEKLSPRVQTMLRDLFPARGEAWYSRENKFANEVFRNFAFPVRDWNPQLRFLGKAGLAGQVAEAQASYVRKLEAVAEDLAAGRIDKRAAMLKVEGAIAEFSKESGLTEAYRTWQSKNLFADKNWNKYVNVTVNELAPLARSFPKEVWEGSLDVRMARLMSRWPNNVRVIDDVTFPFKDAQGNVLRTSPRRVVAISTDGLSVEQKQQLLRDYTDAMARGTVSFPLGENAGHLYTRLGTKVVDSYGGSNIADYSLPGGKRLEPVIALQPEEELKLRFYVENVLKDKQGVLGGVNYEGVASGDTEGTLRNNKPVNAAEGHNCTSWMCTAPIGGNDQALMNLVGARVGLNVYTNPGWWSDYLTGAGAANRIPFVVYWTNESTATVEAAVRSGQMFPNWNFNLH